VAALTQNMTHIIGYVAASFTVSSSIPQVVRILRTRDVYAIPLPLYVMRLTGVVLWLLYGISIHALPVIIANSVSGALIATILFLKIRFSRTSPSS